MTSETGEMTTHSDFLLSLNPFHSSPKVHLVQSKSDNTFVISLFLPLWPKQTFLLLMPSKYTKSSSVFSAERNQLSCSEMYLVP